MRKHLPLALALLLGLGAAACQKPASDGEQNPPATPAPAPAPTPPAMSNSEVTIALDRSAYRPGDEARMTITNGSSRDVGYNPCTRIVERESAGGWTAVPEPDRMCTMEIRTLARGARVTETTDLPRPLAAGRYRLALGLSDMTAEGTGGGAPARALSPPFQVDR